jgi:hypothetical protein
MGHPFLDEKEVIRREFYSKKGIVKKYFFSHHRDEQIMVKLVIPIYSFSRFSQDVFVLFKNFCFHFFFEISYVNKIYPKKMKRKGRGKVSKCFLSLKERKKWSKKLLILDIKIRSILKHLSKIETFHY